MQLHERTVLPFCFAHSSLPSTVGAGPWAHICTPGEALAQTKAKKTKAKLLHRQANTAHADLSESRHGCPGIAQRRLHSHSGRHRGRRKGSWAADHDTQCHSPSESCKKFDSRRLRLRMPRIRCGPPVTRSCPTCAFNKERKTYNTFINTYNKYQ
jgi:hypothetical protein